MEHAYPRTLCPRANSATCNRAALLKDLAVVFLDSSVVAVRLATASRSLEKMGKNKYNKFFEA